VGHAQNISTDTPQPETTGFWQALDRQEPARHLAEQRLPATNPTSDFSLTRLYDYTQALKPTTHAQQRSGQQRCSTTPRMHVIDNAWASTSLSAACRQQAQGARTIKSAPAILKTLPESITHGRRGMSSRNLREKEHNKSSTNLVPAYGGDYHQFGAGSALCF